MTKGIPTIPEIPTIDELLHAYSSLVENMSDVVKLANKEGRSDGGVQRSFKGLFFEKFTRGLIRRAWFDIAGDISDLRTEKGSVTVPIKKDYIKKMKDREIAKHIEKNIREYSYTFKIDVPVYIKEKLVMAVECKSFTENAMLKRILIDGFFVKEISPDAEIVLFQLESQLGGDYSDILKEKKLGSTSTHTLMSYFDYPLHIITLLEGDRKTNEPIHRKEFFKPMKREALENALMFFTFYLERYR